MTNTTTETQTIDTDGHSGGIPILFFFDFMGRYAVDRCGAEEGWITSLLSTACVLPTWLWMSSIVLALAKVELYWTLARYSVTLITLFQMVLLIIFESPPAVLGCGPSRSYPSPQVSISSFAFSIFLCFKSMPGMNARCQLWLRILMPIQLACVICSVIWIGFASPASVLAGCITGILPACLLHHTITYTNDGSERWLLRIVRFLETKLGVHTIDTILNTTAMKLDKISCESDNQTSAPIATRPVVMGYMPCSSD